MLGIWLTLLSSAAMASGAVASASQTAVFLGDSLTAGFGLSQEEAYPALVGDSLREKGIALRVVNAGVSGDTTAGGSRRVAWVLKQKPAYLVIALGANDMLRGIPPKETEANLARIIEQARAGGAKPILLGMKSVANYGATYRKEFDAIYPRLARKHRVPLLPFLVEDTVLDPKLNQPDGIHPTAEGQRRIAARVSAFLLPLVKP